MKTIGLIDNWKESWKFASVQLGVVGLGLMTFLDSANQLWINLPPEVQVHVPYANMIPAALFALSLLGRLLVIKEKTPDGNQQP